MANLSNKHAENTPGEFFVDATCIDCDTCRQLAPAVFADSGDYSYVKTQPVTTRQTREALRALLACPTGSIGTVHANWASEVKPDFPLPLADGVYYVGFTSENSFGGSSYLLQTADGNWLIDSPRYTSHLVRRLEEMGGVRHIFLTHRDDVADASRYAARFGAERVIHRLELSAQPDAERVLDSLDDPVELAPNLSAIPTPGHTRGHCALLYDNRYLFSGDHMWWSRPMKGLNASRRVCWYSWEQQVESVERLLDYRFEWVLPGHGQRVKLPAEEMRRELLRLVERL